MLDPDTSTSPESFDVARLAAGAAVAAVDAGAGRCRPPGRRSPACVRPAITPRPTGRWASASSTASPSPRRTPGPRGCARVAIVDFDVHHGNGTQAAFYDDPAVLFVSSHQYPYYPGTGAATEIGRGAGAGFTVNLPLEAGAGDADVDEVYRRMALPVLDAFAPELVLVSAGFDAHEDDPLAALRMTAPGFANLTRLLLGVAARHAGGRMVLVTEGGYDLDALAASLHAVLEACADGTPACCRARGRRSQHRGRRGGRCRPRRLDGALAPQPPRPDARVCPTRAGIEAAAGARGVRLLEFPDTRGAAASPDTSVSDYHPQELDNEVAGPLARRPDLRGGRGSVPAEVLLPRDVRVSLRATRTSATSATTSSATSSPG